MNPIIAEIHSFSWLWFPMFVGLLVGTIVSRLWPAPLGVILVIAVLCLIYGSLGL